MEDLELKTYIAERKYLQKKKKLKVNKDKITTVRVNKLLDMEVRKQLHISPQQILDTFYEEHIYVIDDLLDLEDL